MSRHFSEPVVTYMTRDPEVAHADTPVDQLARTMHARSISGLPIVDAKHHVIGVVTRTDLIRVGLLQAGARHASPAMALPARRASDVMTHGAECVPSDAPLHEAAARMVDRSIHRVFVTEGDRLAGVLCAIDLTGAVRDAKLTAPISSIMTSPIMTVEARTPLGHATELLDRAGVTGLIVTEEAQPIGVFTQLDALAARDLPRATPIEDLYDAAVMCLPGEMKLSRVAAHAADTRVRRVVVCSAREAVGIVSATDFARVVAGR
jgi:CBS domain-containing protein